MHNKFLIAAALAATATVTGTAGAGFAQDMPADGPGPNLVIEVADEGGASKGQIVLDLYADKAPKHVERSSRWRRPGPMTGWCSTA